MSTGLRELRVWQEAVALAGEVIRAARQNTRRETNVVCDQLMLAAANVPVRIADAYARYTPAEQRRVYRDARLALGELETRLAIARQAALIPAATLAQLSGQVSALARLLTGYLAYIDRQVAAEEEAELRRRRMESESAPAPPP